MLQVDLGRSGRYCDGLSAAPSFPSASPAWPRSGCRRCFAPADRQLGRKNTKVILIWLDGGPGHMDMYDMKPDAPEEYRGLWKPISPKVPGFDVTELYPKQAKITDKFSMVRSLHVDSGDHFAGGHRMLTTKDMGVSGANNAEKFPAIGAIVNREAGPREAGLPGYVALPYGMSIGMRPGYFGGHILGRSTTRSRRAATRAAPGFKVENMNLTAGLSIDQLDDRRSLSKHFDTDAQGSRRAGRDEGDGPLQPRGVRVRGRREARRAFDIRRRTHGSAPLRPAPAGPEHASGPPAGRGRLHVRRPSTWAAGTTTGT